MNDPRFTYKWSDAWFLLAVSYVSPKGEPVGLSQIIGAADYINHAILTVAEIKSATSKLTQDEWISFQAGRFSPTPKMMKRFSSLPAKSPMSQLEIVESWLGAAKFQGNDDPNVMSGPDIKEIDETMVDAATEAYKNEGRNVV